MNQNQNIQNEQTTTDNYAYSFITIVESLYEQLNLILEYGGLNIYTTTFESFSQTLNVVLQSKTSDISGPAYTAYIQNIQQLSIAYKDIMVTISNALNSGTIDTYLQQMLLSVSNLYPLYGVFV